MPMVIVKRANFSDEMTVHSQVLASLIQKVYPIAPSFLLPMLLIANMQPQLLVKKKKDKK